MAERDRGYALALSSGFNSCAGLRSTEDVRYLELSREVVDPANFGCLMRASLQRRMRLFLQAALVQTLGVEAFESVSTWKQPMPRVASPARRALLRLLASRIIDVGPERLRIAVDGYTASGKTSLAHELAFEIRTLGRPTLRASFDDFKKPWSDAKEKGYDRISGDGYYRNAPDFDSARNLLLEPAGSNGSGTVVLCGHDPITGVDHRDVTVQAPSDAVLIVDSVFAMRPEYDAFWDLRIWVDVAPELSLARGIDRDAVMEGRAEAERLHRDRYHESERIYIAEVNPRSRADVVVDNTDFANPVLVRS